MEKSRSSVLAMLATRSGGEEKTPAAVVRVVGRGNKGGPEQMRYRYDVLRPYSMVVALG